VSVDEREIRLAVLVRRLAELYHYTPEEIASLPLRLVALLIADEEGRSREINRLGNRTVMTIEEWNQRVREQSNVKFKS